MCLNYKSVIRAFDHIRIILCNFQTFPRICIRNIRKCEYPSVCIFICLNFLSEQSYEHSEGAMNAREKVAINFFNCQSL